MRRDDPRYGKGEHFIDLHGDGSTDSAGLVERLLGVFRAPTYRAPLLPSVALELLQLANKIDVDFDEVLALLEKDPLVAGRVLQVAQSPLFSRQGAIQSLHHAVVHLGLNTLTELFLEATVSMRVFRAPGYEQPMNALRRHSTATAHVARIVCRHSAVFDQYAFLCGLLHDCGIAAGMVAIVEGRRPNEVPPLEVVYPAILDAHETAAGVLCNVWKLPQDVALALGHHHGYMVGGNPHPLAAAIAVAEWMVGELGFGLPQDAAGPPPSAAIKALRIPDAVVARARAEAKQAVARIQ